MVFHSRPAHLAREGFPYLVCYFVRPDHVDVWRILHASRDLGVLLEGEPDEAG